MALGHIRHWVAAAVGALVSVVLVMALPALAHRVLVFAFVEGDKIQVEAKFVPDTPVRQGTVRVLEATAGRELLTGTTDDQGRFSFPIPAEAKGKRLNLRIVVEAAMGHRGEWLLKADTYLPPAAAESEAAPAAAAGTPAPAALPPGPPPTPGPSPEALEAALHRALERHLAPMKEMLAELSQRRTTLPDVLGGIGYIVGFFGLWAYFQSRRRNRP